MMLQQAKSLKSRNGKLKVLYKQLKNILKKVTQQNNKGGKMFSYYYKKINRRGCEITLYKKDLDLLTKKGYYISLVKKNNKPCTVQLLDKNNAYAGTLKSFYGATGFKDGNVCNFKKSNLIY